MELDRALLRAGTAAFEEMAFEFAVSEGEAQEYRSPIVVAGVDFAGPARGELQVMLPKHLLPGIVANMLGDSTSPTWGEQIDALGELANVILGQVLPTLAGDRAKFEVGSPTITTARVDKPAAEARVRLVGGTADVRLFVDGR